MLCFLKCHSQVSKTQFKMDQLKTHLNPAFNFEKDIWRQAELIQIHPRIIRPDL